LCLFVYGTVARFTLLESVNQAHKAHNQLGVPRGAKSLRGAQIFYTMSNRFELDQNIFLGGLRTPGYGPAVN